MHIENLVQDCSNSSALALELLQFCTKSLICHRTYLIMRNRPRYISLAVLGVNSKSIEVSSHLNADNLLQNVANVTRAALL